MNCLHCLWQFPVRQLATVEIYGSELSITICDTSFGYLDLHNRLLKRAWKQNQFQWVFFRKPIMSYEHVLWSTQNTQLTFQVLYHKLLYRTWFTLVQVWCIPIKSVVTSDRSKVRPQVLRTIFSQRAKTFIDVHGVLIHFVYSLSVTLYGTPSVNRPRY